MRLKTALLALRLLSDVDQGRIAEAFKGFPPKAPDYAL
jgi:hypothetical protein